MLQCSIFHSVEEKVAFHYIRNQPALPQGTSFRVHTQHIILNWFSRNVKRYTFSLSGATATAPMAPANLLCRSLEVCKSPAASPVSRFEQVLQFLPTAMLGPVWKSHLSRLVSAKKKWSSLSHVSVTVEIQGLRLYEWSHLCHWCVSVG